jgi:aerobic C4-dicarboxylate transport protein
MKKIFTNLTFWVLSAITAGALLGHFMPATAVQMKVLGDKMLYLPNNISYYFLGHKWNGGFKKSWKGGRQSIIIF